mmetsp:Transcript_31267/g.85910  ORF Transcript_31267/g.85910 Transcript_31267/m.85910 type:complete len:480 (+) Transcript_31267:1249-2688(+)
MERGAQNRIDKADALAGVQDDLVPRFQLPDKWKQLDVGDGSQPVVLEHHCNVPPHFAAAAIEVRLISGFLEDFEGLARNVAIFDGVDDAGAEPPVDEGEGCHERCHFVEIDECPARVSDARAPKHRQPRVSRDPMFYGIHRMLIRRWWRWQLGLRASVAIGETPKRRNGGLLELFERCLFGCCVDAREERPTNSVDEADAVRGIQTGSLPCAEAFQQWVQLALIRRRKPPGIQHCPDEALHLASGPCEGSPQLAVERAKCKQRHSQQLPALDRLRHPSALRGVCCCTGGNPPRELGEVHAHVASVRHPYVALHSWRHVVVEPSFGQARGVRTQCASRRGGCSRAPPGKRGPGTITAGKRAADRIHETKTILRSKRHSPPNVELRVNAVKLVLVWRGKADLVASHSGEVAQDAAIPGQESLACSVEVLVRLPSEADRVAGPDRICQLCALVHAQGGGERRKSGDCLGEINRNAARIDDWV